MGKKEHRSNNKKSNKNSDDKSQRNRQSGRSNIRGGKSNRGTSNRSGRGGRFTPGSMNKVGFDYTKLNSQANFKDNYNDSVTNEDKSFDSTLKNAPKGPKSERGKGIKQHMPYFVNQRSGGVKGRGLGYGRKSAEEEAAIEEKKASKRKQRGGGDIFARPLLQPISFVKGSNSYDKDMNEMKDLTKVKMAADIKDAEDAFVQVPTEQPVDTSIFDTPNDTSNVVTSTAETSCDENKNDINNSMNDNSLPSISNLNIHENFNDSDFMNTENNVTIDSSAIDGSVTDDSIEIVEKTVHSNSDDGIIIDDNVQKIQKSTLNSNVNSSIVDTSIVDTSIQTINEPNTSTVKDIINDNEDQQTENVLNDDLFVIDTQPSQIPDKLKPKETPIGIIIDEDKLSSNKDKKIEETQPLHSFSRSEIVQIEEPVISSKNKKSKTDMKNENLFKDVHELGQLLIDGKRPSFNDFSFSPGFGKNKKNKKNKKDKKKSNRTEKDETPEPRIGDSDLEWGSEGPPNMNQNKFAIDKRLYGNVDDEMVADWLENTHQDGSDESSGGEEAVGPFGAHDAALRSFANNMSKNQETIHDLAIDKKIRRENQDENEFDSDSSVGIMNESESESESEKGIEFQLGSSDDENIDEDDEIYLDSSLSSEEAYELGRARAKAARENPHITKRDRKGKNKMNVDIDDIESEENFDGTWNKWDEEEEFLDELAAILESKNSNPRKGKYSYDDVGDTLDDDDDDDFVIDPSDILFPTSSKKKKSKVPPQLQRIWDQDRKQKAEKKRLRETVRMQEALLPYSKSKGKKAKKLQMKAALQLSDEEFLPVTRSNIESLNTEIQAFVDVPNRKMMKLPPMNDKSFRKQVHMLADSYNLKSKSIGKGSNRHVMLLKTSKSGLGVDYGLISRATKACAKGGIGNFYKTLHLARKQGKSEKGDGNVKAKPRAHKEGAVVGQEAAPIGEESVGYKMLAMMGWSHGQKMGQSGQGLEAPVTAVIKNSRRGLGAS